MSQDDRRSRQSSSAALQGLDTIPGKESSPTTLGPVSPKRQSKLDESTEAETKDEVEEIERLEERVAELEKQLEREEEEGRVPVVADVDGPSQAEIDRHEATHTPPRKWCKACQKGMAVRGKHERKKKVNSTEAPRNGQTKYSIDYMTMDSVGEAAWEKKRHRRPW